MGTDKAEYKCIESFDGTRLHYRIRKQGKPTLVFIHGVSSNHTCWELLYTQFEAKGYSTLSMDLRGHGKSQDNKSNLKNQVKDIELIINKEKLSNIILIGNSLGAIIALELNKTLENIKGNYLINPVAKNLRGNSRILPFTAALAYTIISSLPKRKHHPFEDFSKYYQLPAPNHLFPIRNIKAFNWHVHSAQLHELFTKDTTFELNKPTAIMFCSKDEGLLSLARLKSLTKTSNPTIDIVDASHLIVSRNPQLICKKVNEFLERLKC